MGRKAELRVEMRARRRALLNRSERSGFIWVAVEQRPEYQRARVIMAFSSIVGEPDTARFIERALASGRRVTLPEDDPTPTPNEIDLVIVPGLAFTKVGARLGQGGGWYDRFLAATTCPTIGVCFAEQLVDHLPQEPHDIPVTTVITG